MKRKLPKKYRAEAVLTYEKNLKLKDKVSGILALIACIGLALFAIWLTHKVGMH